MRLYIDGGRLKEEGVTWFKLRISAVLEGEESGEPCEREFTVDKPYIERQFSFGDRSMLPGWTQWIDRRQGCYVENGQYPFGNHFDLTVTDISVVDIEGEDVALIEFSDENGWEIRAKNAGVSKVTVSYDDWDGSPETEEFNLYVGSDVYDVDLWTDNGSDRILPGGERAGEGQAHIHMPAHHGAVHGYEVVEPLLAQQEVQLAHRPAGGHAHDHTLVVGGGERLAHNRGHARGASLDGRPVQVEGNERNG